MAFGLKVWDASGDLVVDTTHRLPRLVHTQYISSGTTGSVEIPAVADKQAFIITCSVNLDYPPYVMPIELSQVNLSLTILSWSSGYADTLCHVFIYD